MLAANHETHKVVFNLFLEDRRFSPSNCVGATPNCGGPDHICTKACEQSVLFVAVNGTADLIQAALPESKDKINTAESTGSWGRFGSTLRTQSFLLTKLTMVSQQPARWHSKRVCCSLGNWSVQQPWQELMPIFLL